MRVTRDQAGHYHIFMRDAETQHDPKNGQFTGGGGGSGGGSSPVPEKKTVSQASVEAKVKGMESSKLAAAYNHPDIDPKVKKVIGAELDRRADKNRAPPSEKEARMLGLKR